MTTDEENHQGLTSSSASGWYDLIKRVYADFKGAEFKAQDEKMNNFQLLHQSVTSAHEDYVHTFQALIDEIKFSKAKDDILPALNSFQNARKTNSGDRTISKHDASHLLARSEELAERRFLTAVILYFCYSLDGKQHFNDIESLETQMFAEITSGGLHGWESASSAFLLAYRDKAYPSNEWVLEEASSILEQLRVRMSVVETTFHEMEMAITNNRPITGTKITRLVEHTLNQKTNDA